MFTAQAGSNFKYKELNASNQGGKNSLGQTISTLAGLFFFNGPFATYTSRVTPRKGASLQVPAFGFTFKVFTSSR